MTSQDQPWVIKSLIWEHPMGVHCLGVGIHAASISEKQWCGCWTKWGNLPQACTFLENLLLVDKNTNFKNQKNFRLAPSLLDTGAKCPWASGTTYWFFWSCWFLLSGSLLSSQQMGPSRSWRFMPTASLCFWAYLCSLAPPLYSLKKRFGLHRDKFQIYTLPTPSPNRQAPYVFSGQMFPHGYQGGSCIRQKDVYMLEKPVAPT